MNLCDLVRPARIPNPSVDRRIHRRPGSRAGKALPGGNLRHELITPTFEHLGDPIENLPPVVRRRPGPASPRLAGGEDGIPRVLA